MGIKRQVREHYKSMVDSGFYGDNSFYKYKVNHNDDLTYCYQHIPKANKTILLNIIIK